MSKPKLKTGCSFNFGNLRNKLDKRSKEQVTSFSIGIRYDFLNLVRNEK